MPGNFSDDSSDANELLFIDEDEIAPAAPSGGPAWRVLIVDDDEDVHVATELALRRVAILGRPMQFLHAYSAAEARRVLLDEADIAVILLDVVMESEHAGLELVHFVRNEAGLKQTRIVLRTGQPGYAPEIDAIRDYDINDFKTKAELTRPKLYATLTVAIRSYSQLRELEQHRLGLDAILRASNELMEEQKLPGFADGVINKLSALLNLPSDGLVYAQPLGDAAQSAAQGTVLAAAGSLAATLGKRLSDLPDDAGLVETLLASLRSQTNSFAPRSATLYLGGGTERQMVAHLRTPAPVPEIDQQLLEVFCTNISARLDNIELVDKLHDYAYIDQLLGLPNRIAFIEALDRALAQQPRPAHVVAIIGIDHFGDINLALGPDFGDQLLVAVGRRLGDSFGANAMVARVSGDTFGILGPDGDIHPEAIGELFSSPIQVGGGDVSVSVSTGLGRFSEVEGCGNGAFMEASIAAKQAKSGSRASSVYYSREMETQTRQRVSLHQKLRTAFDQKRLALHYQPQLSLETGMVIGCEALLRWQEQGQFIPPNEFIPLAESSGLIIQIGLWVLRSACAEQVRLERAGHGNVRMAVNVSMAQLRHTEFLDWLDAAIADTGIRPSQLELEITESMAMIDPAALVDLLQKIDARGVTVAIDDFGTGFSSLSYLQMFRVHRLKIDQSFVRNLNNQPGQQNSIAELIVQLGHKFGMSVIAEGVEYPEQADFLRSLGCDEVQGFHFARPMDAQALDAWLIGKAER